MKSDGEKSAHYLKIKNMPVARFETERPVRSPSYFYH